MSIVVYLESYEGELVKAGKECITVANNIASKTGKPVIGVITDNNVERAVSQAGNLGVENLRIADGVNLYHSTLYSRYILNATKDADYIIFPATVWGREIAPQVCVKLKATPISDIIEVVNENTFKRSLHGNKVHVSVEGTGKMVLTVRPGVFDVPEETGGSATTETISAESIDGDSMLKLAEVLAASSGKIELTEADIIVSGGRGIGGPENYHLIEELAAELGAAVGASRAVVDAGWRPHSDQVGQTGKFVSPKLYVAVGISGAIQHLAGMSTSDIIVAVNTDEEAPIFKVADYGLVGDLFDVLPKLTETIKTVKVGK